MKKILAIVVVLAVLGAAALFILRGRKGASAAAVSAAEWLPSGTLLFYEIPDIHRSRERWPGTDLAQMIHEPQVQAFLEKPRASVPEHDEIGQRHDQLRQIDPTQFFLAVTEWAGEKTPPKVVLGFSYAGNKDDVDSLVAELRKAALDKWPDGKSDMVKDAAGGDIETFTAQGITAGLAYRGNWVFLSSDLDTLKATLAGYAGGPVVNALKDLPAFKTCVAQIPADPDSVGFVQPKLLADPLDEMMVALQPMGNPHPMASLREIEAVAMGVKMDGALMREAMFWLTLQKIADAPLANNALKLTTDNTHIYSDSNIDTPVANLKAEPTLSLAAMPPEAQPFFKQLEAQGITLDTFTAAFGPDAAFLLDEPPGSPIPVVLFTADVRDGAKARTFLNTSLQMIPGGGFTKQDAGGATYYSMPPTSLGFFPLQITAGISDKFFIAGLTLQAVQDAMKRAAGPGSLGDAPGYKQAMALLDAPTASELYIDDKAIFEKFYTLVRGIASMGMIPHSGDYLDLSKLPDTETISKHLSPMVISSSAQEGGCLVQTAGPVPVYQGAILGASFAAGMAIPYYVMQRNLDAMPSSGFAPTPQMPVPPPPPPGPGVPLAPNASPSTTGS